MENTIIDTINETGFFCWSEGTGVDLCQMSIWYDEGDDIFRGCLTVRCQHWVTEGVEAIDCFRSLMFR